MPAQKEGKVAIVTGAASGIGAATAQALAENGLNVVINYRRNAKDAGEVAQRCRELGVEALCVSGDVSCLRDCQRIVEAALGRWGQLDVLVNNAGTTRFADARDLDALSASDFGDIFAVNVTGAYLMARVAAQELRRSPDGSIVNVSSHSGFSGLGSSTAYATSKGGLNTLTLALARALAPDVRVNAVCPGFVDTDWMARATSPERMAEVKKRAAMVAPLQRLVSPAEVAEAICWFALCGRSITGQLLVIDAGTHLTVGNPI